jgi:hypothetical protein
MLMRCHFFYCRQFITWKGQQQQWHTEARCHCFFFATPQLCQKDDNVPTPSFLFFPCNTTHSLKRRMTTIMRWSALSLFFVLLQCNSMKRTTIWMFFFLLQHNSQSKKEDNDDNDDALKLSWRVPKSLVEPTSGFNFVELCKVGTWGTLPTSSTRKG